MSKHVITVTHPHCFKCTRPVVNRGNARFEIRRGWAHRICPRRRKATGYRLRKRRKVIRYRYGKPDLAATNNLNWSGMLNRKSYVTVDGREILYGEDWKRRAAACLERDRALCQQKIIDDALGWNYSGTPRICGKPAVDADHIIKRSKQRDDRLANLRSLCRFHHNLRHKEFRTRFNEMR